MPSIRTPLYRSTVEPRITPPALEIFAEIERARKSRRRALDCRVRSAAGYCDTSCNACRRWYDLHKQLHTALGLPVWIWPCVPRCPFPPGSDGARAWRPDGDQQALWDLLNEARRATHATESV